MKLFYDSLDNRFDASKLAFCSHSINFVDTVSSYGDDADAQCKYDLCYCDWVAAQCFGQKKSLYSTDKNDYSDTHVCNNTGKVSGRKSHTGHDGDTRPTCSFEGLKCRLW